jgi:iron complex outermembrane recepter protein
VSGAAELRGDTALGERTAALRLDAGTGALAFHFDGFKRKTNNVHIPGFALSRAAREALAAEGETDDTRGRLPNSASESQGAAAGVSWIGEQGFIGVAVSRYETTYGIPGPAEEEGEEPTPELLGAPSALAAVLSEDGPSIDMVQTRYDLRGEYRPEGSIITALKLRGGYNNYEHAELEPDGGVGTQFTQDAWELRLAADHALGALRGTVGVQLRDVDFVADGAEAFIPPSVTRNTGVFLFEELPLDAVTLEFGTRIERQEIDAGGALAGSSRNGTATGFALGAVWKLHDGLRLSAHATRTQRLPGATELFADGPHLAVRRFEIGDATLGKETARTLDVALHGTAEDGPQWQVGVFVNDFQDYLYLQPTGGTADGLGVFEYRQQDARFHGLEAELRLPVGVPTADRRSEVRLAVDLVRGALKDGGGDLPTIPPLRLSAEYGANWGAWSAHVGLQWTDRQDRVAAFETVTPDGLALSADVSWDGPLFGLDSQVFLRGGNLLDQDLRRHTSALKDYAPLPARGVTAGIRIKF